MAVVYSDGFDYYVTGSATQPSARGWSSWSGVNSSIAGRFSGSFCARFANGNTGAQRTLASTYTTAFAGFALNMETTPSGGPQRVFSFLDSGLGTGLMRVWITTAGKIQIVDSSNTSVATGTTVLNATSWYYVEVKLVINGASGSVTVFLNGASEIGATTHNFGSTNIGGIEIGCPSNSLTDSNHATPDIDDLYVCDTTGASPQNTFPLGDSRIETLWPTSDGAHLQWTPNSGVAHFSRVNEATPDGDTSYVFDTTVSDRDSYGFGNLASLSGTIFSVQTNLYARKDNSATRQICAVARPTTVDSDGATVTLGTSYAFFSEIRQTNPDTSAAWSISDVNSSEFGIKVVT